MRDENGKGVLAGLTNISKTVSSKVENGKKVFCDGELRYRGYRVEQLIDSLSANELGFEEITYLLIIGELPSDEELKLFKEVMENCRTLPSNFTRDVLTKWTCRHGAVMLAGSVFIIAIKAFSQKIQIKNVTCVSRCLSDCKMRLR